MALTTIADELSATLSKLEFSEPVTHVYDPTAYAREAHHDYLTKYGKGAKEVVFVGMNPGPWGMAQTGVPFGEVGYARDWLGIRGAIDKPLAEHPKRPIEGFECSRSEVSGRRLWGWAEERFGTADAFFERFYVANYCPLVFMEESGRNRVPEKLPIAERQPLLDACDEALRAVIAELEPQWVVGVGAWAKKRAKAALAEAIDAGLKVGQILHPSPASPMANRGWAPQADTQLSKLGIV